jgi:hypothetical protein
MSTLIQMFSRRAAVAGLLVLSACAVGAPEAEEDGFFHAVIAAANAGTATVGADASSLDGAAEPVGTVEPQESGPGADDAGILGSDAGATDAGAGPGGGGDTEMMAPRDAAPASDANSCNLESCSNQCLLSTSVRCCTRSGACGCAIMAGSVCL